MGRPRKSDREGWPEGLHQRRRSSGAVFYVYRGRHADKEIYLGTDLKAAIRGVGLVNKSRAAEPVQRVISAIEGRTSTVAQHAKWFKEQLEQRELAEETLYNYKAAIDRSAAELGLSRSIDAPTVRDVATLLESLPAWTAKRYRHLLVDFFRHAVARGLRADNPAEHTIAPKAKRARARLKLPEFHKIRKLAAPWFVRVLDVAFWSLQREGDLVQIHIDEHWRDGRLYVRQAKVERHQVGQLAIKPGQQLLAAVVACLNSSERDSAKYGRCPYLLHRIPEKVRGAKGRAHELQLTADQVSREFARLRDRAGVRKDLEPKKRPAFHEIRALGGDHYREVLKWPEERIQALYGHTSADTTAIYLEGHGERWVEVEAG